MRCKTCGEKVITFPLKDSNGKIIWINLFKMDMMSIVWLAVIFLMLITYKVDISKCKEMITDPLGYCEESNACKIIEERKEANPYGAVNINNIPEFNIS